MTAHKQTTDGTAYTTGYLYNLSGAMIEETYPSGRKVRNTLDANGDLAAVDTLKPGGAWEARANSFIYNAAGAPTGLRLGNNRWESTQFNSRLQPTQIALGATSGAVDLLKLDYSYGTTANNGNVLSQTITVPTVGANPGFTAVQTYIYDSLNRLKDAKEMIGAVQTWKQTFTFDRYGNRNFDQANTTYPTSFAQPAVTNPTVNAANNRFAAGQGWAYDAAGNTTADANGQTFVYDAKNKQVQVNGPSGVVGQYWYDGDGKRVKKVVPATNETTVFVYDINGQLVAEYSTVFSATPQVQYLTADHLGTPRIITDQNGAVVSRHDYHPYGEEVFTTQRTQGLGYTADDIRQKFTGYERDVESDLDFAEARMYSNKLGRFTSVDPLTASASIRNPQTFNRYSYVLNSPYKFTDPLGLLSVSTGACGQFCRGGLDSAGGGGGAFDSGRDATFDHLLTPLLNAPFISALRAVIKEAAAAGDTVRKGFAEAFLKIIDFGDTKSQHIARTLLSGGVNLRVGTFTDVSARSGVNDAAGLSDAIASGAKSAVELVRFFFIEVSAATFGNYVDLEANIVHEGQHVLVMSEVAASLSLHSPNKVQNETIRNDEIRASRASSRYLLFRGNEYYENGVANGFIKNKKIVDAVMKAKGDSAALNLAPYKTVLDLLRAQGVRF